MTANGDRAVDAEVLGAAPPRFDAERAIKLLGWLIALAAALATLVTDGELELTLLMAVTVLAALSAFDAALDRQVRSALPWLLVSAAVLARSVPHVVSGLQDQVDATVERLDHAGAIAATLLMGLALAVLALPSRRGTHRTLTIGVLVVASLIAGFAGATAAFAGRQGFGGAGEARWLEGLGWASSGLVFAAAALAAAATPRVTRPRAMVIAAALACGVLGAWEAAGERVDIGWWALAFVLAAGASLLHSPPLLITLAGQNRTSFTALVVAVLSAIVAVRSFVVGLGDDLAWQPAVIALAVLAVAALVIGAGFDRIGASGRRSGESTVTPRVEVEDPEAPQVVPPPEVVARSEVLAGAETVAGAEAPSAGVRGAVDEAAPSLDLPPVLATLDASHVAIPAPPAAASSELAESIVPAWADDRVFWPPEIANDASLDPSDAPDAAVGDAVVDPTLADFAPTGDAERDEAVEPGGAAGAAEPVDSPVPAVATAPARPLLDLGSLAPRDIDPATGLLSGAGLQRAIAVAFAEPVAVGAVTILMISIRNGDQLERELGRVRSANVTATIGQRLAEAMPYASIARYARGDFAAIVRGAAEPTHVVVDRCTNVLLDLLEPAEIEEQLVDVDVAAGLAQSYAGEVAEEFIERANRGLARALDSAEPTLVAMP